MSRQCRAKLRTHVHCCGALHSVVRTRPSPAMCVFSVSNSTNQHAKTLNARAFTFAITTVRNDGSLASCILGQRNEDRVGVVALPVASMARQLQQTAHTKHVLPVASMARQLQQIAHTKHLPALAPQDLLWCVRSRTDADWMPSRAVDRLSLLDLDAVRMHPCMHEPCMYDISTLVQRHSFSFWPLPALLDSWRSSSLV